MRKTFVALLLSAGLTAQTHPHIRIAEYVPTLSALTWTTAEHNRDEQPAPGLPTSEFLIELRTAEMTGTEGKNKPQTVQFEQRESALVRGGIGEFVTFMSDIAGRKPVTRLVLEPLTGTVTVWFDKNGGDSGRATFTSDCKPDLEPGLCSIMNQHAGQLIRYVAESTYWFRAQIALREQDKKRAE